MFLNVNQVINELAAANHTNGLLQAEKEVLEAECEKQALEIKCLRDEISALKEELKEVTYRADLWWDKYQESKALYEKLAETPEEILKDLPEELK